MLLELAIGDAYGAGFEYADAELIRQFNTLAVYRQHPHHALSPGNYTDDTQMSLAIAEAILVNDPWTSLSLADRFVAVFKRDPRVGYSKRLFSLLSQVQSGAELLQQVDAASDRSGAAMRAAPIGLFPKIAEVIERAAIQARITHDTPDGIHAAVAAALMTHYCRYRLGARNELGAFLAAQVPGDWAEPWQGAVGAKGWMSVRAALTALTRNDRMSMLLQDCIAFGGDVDTVATIAMAAGSCCVEIEQDLPAHLVEQLENGPYGRDYLVALDRQLVASF